MSAIVTIEELKVATGYDQASAVEKCLRKNGVRFLYGRNGIFTTIDAFNEAMGLQSGQKTDINPKIDIL